MFLSLGVDNCLWHKAPRTLGLEEFKLYTTSSSIVCIDGKSNWLAQLLLIREILCTCLTNVESCLPESLIEVLWELSQYIKHPSPCPGSLDIKKKTACSNGGTSCKESIPPQDLLTCCMLNFTMIALGDSQQIRTLKENKKNRVWVDFGLISKPMD